MQTLLPDAVPDHRVHATHRRVQPTLERSTRHFKRIASSRRMPHAYRGGAHSHRRVTEEQLIAVGILHRHQAIAPSTLSDRRAALLEFGADAVDVIERRKMMPARSCPATGKTDQRAAFALDLTDEEFAFFRVAPALGETESFSM